MLTFFSKKENTDHTSKEQGKNKWEFQYYLTIPCAISISKLKAEPQWYFHNQHAESTILTSVDRKLINLNTSSPSQLVSTKSRKFAAIPI